MWSSTVNTLWNVQPDPFFLHLGNRLNQEIFAWFDGVFYLGCTVDGLARRGFSPFHIFLDDLPV
jgi:hypothetical protein